MKTKIKEQIVETKIENSNKKGNGKGTFLHDEKNYQVEVPFSIPGDVVKAKILKKKGSSYLGILQEIVQPSAIRVQPRCIHFASCGGCRFQQTPYEKQLNAKEDFVKESFKNLNLPETLFRPIIPCDSPWEYRNKMEFTFSTDASKNNYLGLVKDSSKGRVFELTECHLVNPWFAETVKVVREWWNHTELEGYRPLKDTGSLRTLVVREGMRSGDRMVVLTVSGNPDYALQTHHLESFVNCLVGSIEPTVPGSNLSIFLRIQQVSKGTATNFYEMLLYGPDHIREILNIRIDPEQPPLSLTFHISPTAFFQPNTFQAEKLFSTALRLANVGHDDLVYDLYCGTGTIGMCIANRSRQVVGIEVSPESALDAKTNAQINGLKNITILSGAVRHVLNQIKEEYPNPDIVIVDPPRPGLDREAIKQLVEMAPPKILYISCNPASQAMDVEALREHGYEVEVIQPVDQFPHTAHIENIALLVKKG